MADYITKDTPLPETIIYNMQPYGEAVLGQLSLEWYNGFPMIRGVVVKGYSTAYLAGHTSTRKTDGEVDWIYGVMEHELKSGRIVRVAM